MNNSLITMVTVCLNAETTIARTIESVKEQQFTPLEYIVIDGGSSDSTPQIVRSFGSLVDIFVGEPDNGIADAFNKGISLASGGIIGFINADDQLLPGALATVCQRFAASAELDVLHCKVLLYDRGSYVKRVAPAGRWWYPWRMVLFNHPSTFVRKRVYDQYGLFDTSYKYAMDDALFLRWVKAGVKIEYLAEPLVRMNAGGLSSRFALKVFSEKRRALLANGFPRILADIQYLSRCLGQVVVLLQQWTRKTDAKGM